jgi:hypothetical protein
MPLVLNETIHYSVAGVSDAISKLRTFALACGWTVPTWNGSTELEIHSNGYSVQEMGYRFRQSNLDASNDIWEYRSVIPGQAGVTDGDFIASNTTGWGGSSSYYRNQLPSGTFTALYLYGNELFIAMIWHVDPIAVVTHHFGTVELYPSWRNYPGLFYTGCSGYYGSGSDYSWENIASNTEKWLWGPSFYNSTYVDNVWWQGEARSTQHHQINFRPSQIYNAWDQTAGGFNVPRRVLNYNAFTGKRVIFPATYFCKDDSSGVWYPIGNSIYNFINGTDLLIGEEVTFGTDTYRCFPIVYSTYDVWQAYRTA